MGSITKGNRAREITCFWGDNWLVTGTRDPVDVDDDHDSFTQAHPEAGTLSLSVSVSFILNTVPDT